MQVFLKVLSTVCKFCLFVCWLVLHENLPHYLSSMSSCSGLSKWKKKIISEKKKRSSSILTCFLCTCFGYTYCKLHRIYTNPLVYSVINNMYPWFVTTALLFYENGLFLTRSEIRLASSYLEKKKNLLQIYFANILLNCG